MEDKAKERILKIQKSQELLQEAVGRLDRILYERILEKIEAITQDPSEIERIFREFSKADHVKVIRQFASGIMAIGSMNADYFASVAEDLDSKDYGKFKKQVDSTILERFGLDKDGKIKEGYYLDSFINDKSIPRSVREFGYKAQASGLGYDEVRKGFKDLILGEKGDSGLYKNYYRTYCYDTYQQVDAAVQEAYSEKLGLKALMYLGGLMDTSRSFCQERNGKVYLKEEVKDWKELKFQGKPKNYNPFLDRGGYSCRHHLNYISNQMAVQRRSDLFIDDDGNLQIKGKAPVKVEPETKQQATEANQEEDATQGFKPAKNLDEAIKRIQNTGIRKVDLSNAEIDQANTVLEAIESEARFAKLDIGEFRLRKGIHSSNNSGNGVVGGQYIGNENAAQRILQINTELFEKNYYVPIKKLSDEVSLREKRIVDLKESIKLYESKLGVSPARDKAYKKDIKTAKAQISDFEYQVIRLKRDIEAGKDPLPFNVSNLHKEINDQVKTSVIHEIGHYRDEILEASAKQLYNTYAKQVSVYGSYQEEYFAEWYAFYRMFGKDGVPEDLVKLFDSIK